MARKNSPGSAADSRQSHREEGGGRRQPRADGPDAAFHPPVCRCSRTPIPRLKKRIVYRFTIDRGSRTSAAENHPQQGAGGAREDKVRQAGGPALHRRRAASASYFPAVRPPAATTSLPACLTPPSRPIPRAGCSAFSSDRTASSRTRSWKSPGSSSTPTAIWAVSP